MTGSSKLSRGWLHISLKFLPFADAATDTLPLSRLLRLSLFQISVGMALAMLIGTLNRVMIVELKVPRCFGGHHDCFAFAVCTFSCPDRFSL
jgi:MFS transporter, BCD family, chlorophyll transporter